MVNRYLIKYTWQNRKGRWKNNNPGNSYIRGCGIDGCFRRFRRKQDRSAFPKINGIAHLFKSVKMNHNPDLRIAELGLILPPVPKPAGIYKPVLVVDNYLYVSGQGPVRSDGTLITGKLGTDLSTAEGKMAARQVGLTMLSTIRTHFGELKKIKRIVKVLGMVNSSPNFEQQPSVVNGFSELMADVFGGENGIGVRSAVGMILPSNIAVEVEAVFELY